MENYFQPKENLKTEENVNDFAEETVKNNMQEDDQNGDIEEQKNLEINAQNENTENAQDEDNDDIQGDMKETAGTESENSTESGIDKENFELLNGENLQGKPDNFVLNDAGDDGVDSAATTAENLAENETENTGESGIKDQHENETENFAYIMPSGNYFKPQSANDTAFNKTQKQPAIKKLPFVFSMLGLLLSIFYIGLPFAIAGLVMTIIQKHKGETDELTKTSYVLSFAGIAIGLFTLILFVFCLIF